MVLNEYPGNPLMLEMVRRDILNTCGYIPAYKLKPISKNDFQFLIDSVRGGK
jgi:hypothetical protein